MSLNIDKSLGLLSRAIDVHEKRASLIGENIANSETPGYKARDIDFRAVLNNQTTSYEDTFAIRRTNDKHLPLVIEVDQDELLYRNPAQPALDGNTVDANMEKAAFAENNGRYVSSVKFAAYRFDDLNKSIKGNR